MTQTLATPEVKRGRQIRWYRTAIDKDLLRQLSQRSDLLGAVQTLGYLGLFAGTAAASIYCAANAGWPIVMGVLFLHGMVTAFMINGVHELGHNTVFKTKGLNTFFVHVLAFLGWINHRMFAASHGRHHAYTLHPPDDLEVVLPIKLAFRHFLNYGFINPMGLYQTLRDTARIAMGRFQGPWELTLFPEGEPQRRRPAVAWARVLLIGHGLLVAVSIYLKLWMLPVVITLAPFYGGWLFFLCNNTQHIGLTDNTPDFRLCCRTITLNPVLSLLYWRMNFHTEHHMYPTVPCYHLAKLHRAVRHDLPECPAGLIQTWREIIAILTKQRDDPAFRHIAIIPVRPPLTGGF